MKTKLTYLTAAAYAAFMLIMPACSHDKNELAHDHAHEHAHEHEHNHGAHEHEGHDHGAGQEIVLEPEMAASMGVETEKVTPAEFANTIRVTGTITGTAAASGSLSAPKAGIFTFNGDIAVGKHVTRGQAIGSVSSQSVTGGDSNAAAKAALDAAKRELDRLTPLYEKQLVTADRYNAAVAAYDVAKAQYSPNAASGVVTAPISGVITQILVGQGQYVEPGTVIATVADGSTLTLTADVPDRYAGLLGSITDARIIANNTDTPIDLADLGGSKVTGAATVSTTPGYVPVVFTFKNDGSVVPGSVVEVYLIGDSRPNVITAPLSAVTEQQGNYFVYIRVDEHGYLKSPVTPGQRDGKRVEILHGLHAGDEMVIHGVTALRLAENAGAVPEGHTHSH